jgi:hypothetical protein
MEPDLFSKYAYAEKVQTHADYHYTYIACDFSVSAPQKKKSTIEEVFPM